MTSLVVIPWAETDWRVAGRMAAATPLHLNEAGIESARRWAKELASCELVAIYRSDEKTAVQTAELVAEGTEVRTKCVSGLKELELGLWEGLTDEQIRQRFPKVHKLWEEQPEAVCPPDGEDLVRATERLGRALHKIAQKHKNGAVGVVLGPFAFTLARCHLEDQGIGQMWKLMTSEPVWYRLDGTPHSVASA